MYGELQAVAEWLALHVIRSKPKKNVSYHYKSVSEHANRFNSLCICGLTKTKGKKRS